jgi:hypothetical protein
VEHLGGLVPGLVPVLSIISPAGTLLSLGTVPTGRG